MSFVKPILISSLLVWSFNAFAEPTYSNGFPEDLKKQIQMDTDFVKTIDGTGGTPIYQKMFGDKINGTNLEKFLNDRIFSYGLDSCGGGNGIAACVYPDRGGIMWITQKYITFNLPQIHRLSIIYHESRHTETKNDFWLHENCPRPYKTPEGKDQVSLYGTVLAGQPACDNTAFGAYGLQLELLKNVDLYCSNCSEKIKMDAKIYGKDLLNRFPDEAVRTQLSDDVQISK